MLSALVKQPWGDNTNRFSLGHVPVQPSTYDKEVDLFIAPVIDKESFSSVSYWIFTGAYPRIIR